MGNVSFSGGAGSPVVGEQYGLKASLPSGKAGKTSATIRRRESRVRWPRAGVGGLLGLPLGLRVFDVVAWIVLNPIFPFFPWPLSVPSRLQERCSPGFLVPKF